MTDVIRLRNKKDHDPTNYVDFNDTYEFLYFCKNCNVANEDIPQLLTWLEEGHRVDGSHFGEPLIYLEGATQTSKDRGVIIHDGVCG